MATEGGQGLCVSWVSTSQLDRPPNLRPRRTRPITPASTFDLRHERTFRVSVE